MRPATSPPAEAAGACSPSPSSSSPAAPAAAPAWPVHACRRRRARTASVLASLGAAPLAAALALLLLLTGPLTLVGAARPGRPDASVEPASAALRSLLAASKPSKSGSAPAPAVAIPADVRDRLAKANAVLALRKAGLLPGNARLPASLQAKTVDAVNAAAPAYDIPGVGKARPVLTQQVGGDGGDGGGGAATAAAAAPAPAAAGEAAPNKKWGPPPGWLASAPTLAPRRGWDAGPAAATGPVRAPAGVNATGPLADLMAVAAAAAPAASASPPALAPPHDKALDGRVRSNALIGELGGLGADQSTGSVIQMLGGFRIATPWFGTGFNFCVDRYFGSFPKVGIVIPNAAAWLLPDLAALFGEDPLHATVNLPGPGRGLPKDASAEPTSDGFVIWMPSTQPLYISNFGFRYSLQVAQLFGVDFGFGILKIGCRVDFVRV